MPKASRGALLPPLGVTRVRRKDIYRQLRNGILDGTLPSKTRLPSTRGLAREYKVSRTTVEDVYQQLETEGFLLRLRGSGSFVSSIFRAARTTRTKSASIFLSKRGARLAADARCREPDRVQAFDAGVPDTDSFPGSIWKRCIHRTLRELDRRALNHADPRGYWPLRSALARHLAQFRGVNASPERIVVFSSSQQALLALSILLLEPGDAAWLEDPGYPGARAAFRLAGAHSVPVPVDEAGLIVPVGRRRAPRARLCYVTPAHQYPTGVVLAPERRLELLAWAQSHDAAVIEDDYDGEFRHVGQPLTALQALDSDERVIHVGTLSKAMFLSLRLAYAVLPAFMVEPLANLRTQLDSFPPLTVQAGLAAFIDEGHLAAHVRRMRAIYAEKRSRLIANLASLADARWDIGPNAAGVHVALFEPDAGMARSVASKSKLSLATLSNYSMRSVKRDGLFLRYGGLPLDVIEVGAAKLQSDCLATGRSRCIRAGR